MGTEVELLLDAEPGAESEVAFAQAEREFERLEALLSRFRPDSSSPRSTAPACWTPAPTSSPSRSLALEARERTGGLFDPTVHDALVAAGYDRTFDEVRPGRGRAAGEGLSRRGPDRGKPIELEPGFRLDLGGIAKGYAVDRALESSRQPGPPGQRGRRPRRPRPALADRRRDRRRGAHARARERRDRHLGQRSSPLAARRHRGTPPDRPRTGGRRRATTSASPSAPTAVEAEVLAKAVFLGAPDRPAVLVTADGRTVLAGGLG